MLRLFSAAVLASSVLLANAGGVAPGDDDLRKKPITLDGAELSGSSPRTYYCSPQGLVSRCGSSARN